MAIAAEGNQILRGVTALGGSPLDMVNLELLWASAILTPPAVALEHLSAESFVGLRT
jgi:hypothetical protein